MPKTLRQKLLLALIALLLIVAGYYWNVGLELFNEQPTRPSQDNTIDYYAENAHSLQYQEDGSLDYEMTAVKLEHQKATDITFVTTPDLLLFRGNVQPGTSRAPAPKSDRKARRSNSSTTCASHVPMPRANQAS